MAIWRVQETRPALSHAGHDADEDLQAVAHLGRLAVETQGAQIDLPPLPDRITPAAPVIPRAIEAGAKALALNQDQCASSRLAIWDEADPHPAKQEYWAVNAAQREAGMEEWLALMRERKTLRDRVRELEAAAGLAPRSDQAQAGRAEDEELSI